VQPQGGAGSATLFDGMAPAEAGQHAARAKTLATKRKRKQILYVFSRILGSVKYSQPRRH